MTTQAKSWEYLKWPFGTKNGYNLNNWDIHFFNIQW
jgi:hypothetical protein